MNIKKNGLPLVSVIIATHNSGKVLNKVLFSIRKQDFPKNKIEILIIDGQSTDKTLSIARKYKARIFNNPKVDQVYGKHIGYLNAKGKYVMLIDSDEVLENKESIKNKIESFRLNKSVKVVISSGYIRPKSYPTINSYMSEFGDPFTYFMYHDSKDPNFFLKNLVSKYKKVGEDKKRIVFDFYKSNNPPFIELTSMAAMIDLSYVKKNLPKVLKDAPLHTHLFYLLNTKGNLFAVMKKDTIIHYSASTLINYLKKLRSRIKNNIYGTSMGQAGFKGRQRYQSANLQKRKFLFILYVLSVVLPIIDSIYIAVSRGRAIYLLHFGLCLYTLLLIIFYYSLKIVNVKVNLVGYGS